MNIFALDSEILTTHDVNNIFFVKEKVGDKVTTKQTKSIEIL